MRDDWDTYFMKIADLVSSRATCDRKHVGAVIVRDRHILATGYNGSVPNMPHCDDVGHDIEDGHCVRTVHAEVNALAQAAKLGIPVKGATLYCNTLPCWGCFKTLVSSGITEIVWHSEYNAQFKDKVFEAAKDLPGFVMRKFDPAARFIGQDIWADAVKQIRRIHGVKRDSAGKLVVELTFDSGQPFTITFDHDHDLFDAWTDAVKARNYLARKDEPQAEDDDE